MKPKNRMWYINLAAVFLLLATGSSLQAQTATLRGTVTDAQTGSPLSHANIVIARDGLQTGVTTNGAGAFEKKGLAPGIYSVTVTYLGYEKQTISAVELTAGSSKALEIALKPGDVLVDPIVISASRRQEKALEAPAAIATVQAAEIEQRVSMSSIDHIRGLPGVDIASNGLVQNSVVVRGFNSVFATGLLVLTDNRYANIPSLRVNNYSLLPLANEDIARIEVVSGPGSALYGPNANNGVLHIISRSPFESAGTSISFGGGGRDFFNFSNRAPAGGSDIFTASVRHAGRLGSRMAYKISGHYIQGSDWESYDPIDVTPRKITFGYQTSSGRITTSDTLLNQPDFNVKRIAAEARLDWRLSDDATLIFNAGTSQIDEISLTTIGAFQVQDWRYSYAQMRFQRQNFFAQAFINASDAGETFALRTGDFTRDQSKLIVGQVQHGFKLGDRQRFTYGFDALLTRPDTKSTIHGRNESIDNTDEFGIYLQSETKLTSKLDLVAAARLDDHNHLDPQFSPRAALVFKPAPAQSMRLTYNRAFKTPTTATYFVDILSAEIPSPLDPSRPLLAIRAFGTPGELTFRRGNDGRPQMMSQLLPPGTGYVPADVNSVWPALRQILILQSPQNLQALLNATLPQTLEGTIAGDMRMLNTNTGGFDLVTHLQDRPALKPEINNTFELGYKGVIGGKLLIGASIYHTKYKNFISELQIFNPNVFANPVALGAALQPTQAAIAGALAAQGLPAEQAQAQAATIVGGLVAAAAQLPLGVVSPEQIGNDTDVLLINRNFGDISVNGLDLSLAYFANERWLFSGSYSFVTKQGFNLFARSNRVYWENVDGVDDIALNAPGSKAAIGVEYRIPQSGFAAELRGRYIEGFPMKSGVYDGEVHTYTLFDLSLNYRLPFASNTRLTLSAWNLLDYKHREFVGAPILGRLMLARVTQTF